MGYKPRSVDVFVSQCPGANGTVTSGGTMMVPRKRIIVAFAGLYEFDMSCRIMNSFEVT